MYLLGGCVTRVERCSGTAAESVGSVTEELSEQATAVGRQSSSVVYNRAGQGSCLRLLPANIVNMTRNNPTIF